MDESYRSPGSAREQASPAPVHFMRWAPADWLGSVLRGELALERDHVARLVYRELLDVLHQRGGYLPRAEVAGAVLVTAKQAERAVERLLRSRRLQQTDDGRLFNPRVLRGLEGERSYRAEQAKHGRDGARSRWAGRGVAQGEPRGSDDLPTPTPTPAPAPTPAPISEPRSVSEGVDRRDDSGFREEKDRPRDDGAGEGPLKARIEKARQRFADWGFALRATNELRALIAALPWREVEHALELTNAARVDRHAEDLPAYFVGILQKKRAAATRGGADRG